MIKMSKKDLIISIIINGNINKIMINLLIDEKYVLIKNFEKTKINHDWDQFEFLLLNKEEYKELKEINIILFNEKN
jgi:hypothetical protein